MIGAGKIVVDRLGHADKAHRAAHALAVRAQLADRVHRIVAADIENRADVLFGQQRENFFKRRRVFVGIRELHPAGSEIRGRRSLEQGKLLFAEDRQQIDDAAFQQPLHAVAHSVYLRAQRASGGNHAGKACVNYGGRPAGLSHQNVFACKHSHQAPFFPASVPSL